MAELEGKRSRNAFKDEKKTFYEETLKQEMKRKDHMVTGKTSVSYELWPREKNTDCDVF